MNVHNALPPGEDVALTLCRRFLTPPSGSEKRARSRLRIIAEIRHVIRWKTEGPDPKASENFE